MPSRNVIVFEVPFVAGLERPRITTRGGRPRQYDTKNNVDRKALIAEAYRESSEGAYGHVVMAGARIPVTVRVETFDSLPTSRPKSVESEADTFKPDIDNVIKLVLDALNGVAWSDDAQVTRVIAYKHPRFRGEKPHTEVCVSFERKTHEEEGT